jgi:fatty-acid peroxygenase
MQIAARAREFKAMVDGAGALGPRNWQGHLMRRRTERWTRRLVRRIRSGEIRVAPGSAAEAICGFRDSRGHLLDVAAAAVELINLLRPTVANARYIVFSAMALHQNPEWQGRLRQSDDDLDEFADEVRRFYPFIPFIGGRVLQAFTWRNHDFKKEEWVLIDLYGTNHDPRIWGDPENFRPDRFHEQSFGPFDLVSHGAGDRRTTHRCPGEWITVEQIKTIARLLVREMRYDVPPQDLRIAPIRIPALPRSHFIMEHVQAVRV